MGDQHRLKIGMIGAGFIGQLAHLMNFAELDSCRVVAVAEMRPELRRRVAARYEIPRTYATHHELLKDPDVEAVVVVVPRPFTGPIVMDCLKAGKHVLSEKPMAGTVEQSLRLVEEAERQGVQYVVGYMKRHDEGVQEAKRILDHALRTGELGDLNFVRAHCFMGESYCRADGHVVTDEQAEYSDSGWAVAPEDFSEENARHYHFYLNTFSHNTNLLRFLLGQTPEIEHVRFEPVNGRLAVLDFGSYAATLETGRTSDRDWDESTEFFFEHGRLSLKTPPALLKNVPASVELYRAGEVQQVLRPRCDWTWAFRRQAQAFVDGVLNNQPSLSPGRDALEDVRLIEEMWRRWSKQQS